MNSRSAAPAGLLCGLVLLGTAAEAQPTTERTLSLGVGVGHTDNVARSAVPISATYSEADLSVTYVTDRPRRQTSLNGALSYTDYDIDSGNIDSPLAGSLAAALTLGLVPSRLNLVMADTFGTVREDVFSAASPLNRQYLNVFEIGPDVFLPLGSRNTLNIGGRHEDRRWQRSDFLDSEAVSSSLGISRQLSATQSLGLNVTQTRVEFEDQVAPPFDIVSVFGSYDRQFSSGGMSFSVGTSRLELGEETSDGPLLRLSWQRAVGASSTLSVFGRREFEDAGDEFSAYGFRAGEDGDGAPTADPRTRSELGVRQSIGRNRTSIGWGVTWGRDRQETEVFRDRDTASIEFTANVPLSPRWGLRATLIRSDETFTSVDGDAEQRTLELAFGRPIGGASRFSIDFFHFDRESDFGDEEPESRIRASFTWELL